MRFGSRSGLVARVYAGCLVAGACLLLATPASALNLTQLTPSTVLHSQSGKITFSNFFVFYGDEYSGQTTPFGGIEMTENGFRIDAAVGAATLGTYEHGYAQILFDVSHTHTDAVARLSVTGERVSPT